MRAEVDDWEDVVPPPPESGTAPRNTVRSVTRRALDNATCHYDADVDPGALDRRAEWLQIEALVGTLRSARAVLRDALAAAAVAGVDDEKRSALLRELSDVSEIRAVLGVRGARAPGSAEADLALRGLRELAALYAPYAPPLGDASSVAAFLEQLGETMGVLLEAFASVRFAHRCENNGVLPEEAPRRMELGARLLDWTRDAGDARRELSSEVFDVVAHRARMTADAQRATADVLDALSPGDIEASVKGLTPLRSRALWAAFRRRHERLRERSSGGARATQPPVARLSAKGA